MEKTLEKEHRSRVWRLKTAVMLAAGLVVCVVVWLFWNMSLEKPSAGLRVLVEQEGRVVYEGLLQDESGKPVHVDGQIHMKGSAGEYIVEFQDGKVRMLLSHCPDKICMNEGWTETPSRPVICLPQKIIISVEYVGNGYIQLNGPDLDAVVK